MKTKIKQYRKHIFLACIFVISCILGTVMLEYNGGPQNSVNDTLVPYTAVENENIINVTIKGEVAVPGIYTVTEYSRISDVVNLAGGLTNNADTLTIDLSEVLYEGQEVVIPAIGDPTIAALEENKIDINTASALELELLPGIGHTYSTMIISYRNKYGDFEVIEDIMNVDGISEKRFNEIKDYICVNQTERTE